MKSACVCSGQWNPPTHRWGSLPSRNAFFIRLRFRINVALLGLLTLDVIRSLLSRLLRNIWHINNLELSFRNSSSNSSLLVFLGLSMNLVKNSSTGIDLFLSCAIIHFLIAISQFRNTDLESALIICQETWLCLDWVSSNSGFNDNDYYRN